jgi:UDP:flavonoid glycosyltransferase YjiC (YdhE family)
MRLLFTCVPAHGRFFPVAPVARAAVRRAHDVLFATAPSIIDEIDRAGLRAAPVGVGIDELRQHNGAFRPEVAKREDRIASFMFTNVWPESALPGLLEIGREWRPDAIIHEEGEFTAPLAAALLRVPSIAVSWAGPARTTRQWEILDRAIAPLWRSRGLAPARRAGLFRTLYLDTCPRVLQEPSFVEENLRPLRPDPCDGADSWRDTEWLEKLGSDAIFVTLGTVAAFNNAPILIRQVIDAFKDQPRQLAISTGEVLAHDSLGEIPENVHLTKFVPQSLLAKRTALVICHAGPGTATCALRSGLPLLLMPRGGAVQQRVAAACAKAGVALVLPTNEVTVERILECSRELIMKPAFRRSAEDIAQQIADMPGPDEAMSAIETAISSYVDDGAPRHHAGIESRSWMRRH